MSGDGLDHVRALLPGEPLEVVGELGGSSRSVVRRVRAGERTVIVKEFTAPGEGWVRERAALSVLPPGAPAPRLIGAADSPPTVVLEDAGGGGSVADALLGTDPEAAARAVLSWARTLGTFHRATTGSRAAFRRALAGRAEESTVATDLGSAAAAIAAHGPRLGVDVPGEALAELRGLADLAGPEALTPADACPDNNIVTDGGLVLIDFEAAQWRHLAWDAAYLAVPWPSCWCAWRLPSEVAHEAVGVYRAALPVPPSTSDVAAAGVGWAYISVGWFLPLVLAGKKPNPARRMPTYRAMIQDRLRQARRNTDLPALAGLADRLHEALVDRWGRQTLDHAPAFTRA